jgi:hypothetical protein
VTYSYTQIGQYLSCPRRYKHRYLDGWKETDTRAAMLFGRAFELAIAAYFQHEDAAAVLYREWAAHRESQLYYSQRDSWDRMLQFGVQLLERFAQDDRVRIRQPQRNLQVKYLKPLPGQNDFVAHVDAIGELDGTRCLLEWKTTASRYPEEPTGLLALDPQLVCYSWVTGIAEVAQVVFVRKRLVEIQYFRTVITDEQREEFGRLVQNSIQRIESADFLPHSGIRFPQNPCTSCPYIGLCLGRPDLAESRLVRRPGAATLVGLTSLRSRNPPMLPKLNPKRARFVLTKIDEILALERRLETERDTCFVELGRYLCEVRAGQYWRVETLKSFDEFLERRFPESRRKAYYLMSIHEHLPPQARRELKEVGWTKGLELAKVAWRDGQDFDCATWLHKAHSLPKDQFKREVEKELNGQDSEPWEIIYFKLYKTQIPIVEQAIEAAALMLGTDKSRGYCLEMICADFLAGASLDHDDPNFLLQSMSRLMKFLPCEQRRELISQTQIA